MSEQTTDAAEPAENADRRPLITVAWLWVGLPFAYGLYELILKVTQLFKG
jgi:hypothetical protein